MRNEKGTESESHDIPGPRRNNHTHHFSNDITLPIFFHYKCVINNTGAASARCELGPSVNTLWVTW